jgi:hypothetical protein
MPDNLLKRVKGEIMLNNTKNFVRYLSLIVLVAFLAGCAPSWAVEILQDSGTPAQITHETWVELSEAFPEEVREGKAVRLERALWESGVEAIDHVQVDGKSFPWEVVCKDSWLLKDGRVQIGDEVAKVEYITVVSPPELPKVAASLIDLAPTIAHALGVDAPALTTGRALGDPSADRVVYIFLDGLGYRRYQEIKGEGITPFLDSLGEPLLGITVFPSITKVATAAMLTGTTPKRNGVREHTKRQTQVETIFHTLAKSNRSTFAVEGSDNSFNLPQTKTILSGDRDGDGSTDDNVLANSIKIIEEGMPDFLWVHFHGIDDVGHQYGPRTDEEVAKIKEVDSCVKEIVSVLPANTFVIICSDHGMHAVQEGDRLGNHGSLQAMDMFVPIWLSQR